MGLDACEMCNRKPDKPDRQSREFHAAGVPETIHRSIYPVRFVRFCVKSFHKLLYHCELGTYKLAMKK